MQNSQQAIHKAPFIYPEYLSNMTAKMKPAKTDEKAPILSAMNNYNGLLFPSGLGEFTSIDELKRPPSSSTSTTAWETINTDFPLMSPQTQCRRRTSSLTVASEPAQPLLYASTNPMNRGMFMSPKMPTLMSSAFSGGFSNLFSRKVPIPTPTPPPVDAKSNKGDQSPRSTTPSKRLCFPESHMMLVPTSPSASTSTTATTPPPPFRNISLTLRKTAAPSSIASTASREANYLSSNSSITSTVSYLSQTSHQSLLKDHNKIRVKGGSKIRAKGCSPRNTCASCVCRDQKLNGQRKEIDHLKNVISDLLVLSMESRSTMGWSDDDDDSLEDLPLPQILEESAPHHHEGDLIKVSEMNISPSRQTFCDDPQDPLKTDKVASSSAMLQMSHSLRIKQYFKRGSSSKIPKKMRHLRIQVNGNWGYYSGPTPAKDLALVGCVVRFDDGDLYLGNMENSFFHGPGAYYPKGGRVLRGNFCRNKLK